MKYTYHIKQFQWSPKENTFSAFALHLDTIMADGTIHPYAFANMKEQFYILNPETGGRRRFRFVKEETESVDLDECEVMTATYWLFESEDGIKCKVWIT